MTEVSATNFGLLIAYRVPGFTALWGTSYFSETVRHWLSGSGATTPTVGGFMYITLASVAAGECHRLIYSCQPEIERCKVEEYRAC